MLLLSRSRSGLSLQYLSLDLQRHAGDAGCDQPLIMC